MGNVKLTGILKLSLDQPTIESVRTLWTQLPAEAHPLAVENLHVTLAHQNVMKPFKTFLSGRLFPEGPKFELDNRIFRISRPDRTSWIALVKHQSLMQNYIAKINDILAEINCRIEEDRVFHVSLANLDGSPFASVGDVRWDDVGGRDVLQR